jgi:hypothetical protein
MHKMIVGLTIVPPLFCGYFRDDIDQVCWAVMPNIINSPQVIWRLKNLNQFFVEGIVVLGIAANTRNK